MISPMWVAVGLSNAQTAGPPGVIRTAWYWFMFIANSGQVSGIQDRIRTRTRRDDMMLDIVASCEGISRLSRLL